MESQSISERIIILIDMNAYFASIEQHCNPELRGKPIGVCGQGRTIITTASYEARAYGVKTGMTLPEARKLCPRFIPVVGNLDKYVDTSLRIHKILLDYTDLVEVFSIDECFMDITGTHALFGGAEKLALDIKKRIKSELGILCSIGIAPNKVVAKIAAKSKKPDGLVIVPEKDVPVFMENLPVAKLQGVGIGRQLERRLLSLGIDTAKKLGAADERLLKDNFGILGRMYKNIGLGKDSSEVKKYSYESPVKSVGHSHTLPADTMDISVIRSYLLMLSEKTAVRLREYKLLGRTAFLAVRFEDFEMTCSRATLHHYFNSGVELFEEAWKIFERLLPLKKRVRLLGVSISSLATGDGQQYIFEDMQKREKLTQVMDEINDKYGAFTIKPSSIIKAEKHGILERCGIMSTRLIK
jgi:DNA polymerase-4